MSPEPTDLAAVLKNTHLFSSLSQPELQLLAQRTVRKLFSAGELLFSEGEPCNGLNIISRGKVRIFKTSVNGREQVLAIESPGDSVAELPVFDGGPYPASAVAVENTEIAFVSRHDFQAYCLEHPEVALKVLAVVGARLRNLLALSRSYRSPQFVNGLSLRWCDWHRVKARGLHEEWNSLCRAATRNWPTNSERFAS